VLKVMADTGKVPYIYKDAHSIEELTLLLRQWTQRQYSRYSLAYIGYHGEPGMVWVGRKRVTLDDLADMLNGRCKGKTLYFGSCSTLRLPKREVEAFRATTKARCVMGYTTDVGWYEGIGFDVMLFGALTWYQRIDAVDKYLRKTQGPLVRRLGFKMYYGA
jgi:hypothetical protein